MKLKHSILGILMASSLLVTILKNFYIKNIIQKGKDEEARIEEHPNEEGFFILNKKIKLN
jgi:hypothetical protein